MRIGFVVDGKSEYRSLAKLFPQLSCLTGNTFLRVVRADIQPTAPFGAMARACKPRLVELEGRRADRIIILVDREQRVECPGEFAVALGRSAQTMVDTKVGVVVKNRCFENWLIADLDALGCQPGRFRVSASMKRRVTPNKADLIDALPEIKAAVLGDYDKVADSERILANADVSRCALHSRSFRRFLRLVGVPAYRDQSARPHAGVT